MSAIGYVRLSPGERAAGGLGLEAQRDAIGACARAMSLDLGEIHEDASTSGGKALEDRPGLMAAIADLGKGDVLIVAKLDRLTRGDAWTAAVVERAIEDRGARYLSAAGEATDDDEPSSILMRRILSAFAEYERLMIGVRTKAALGVKKKRGEKTGGAAPYGWRVGAEGKLEKEPSEQEALRFARRWRERGYSLGAIGAELERRGFKAKSGGRWFPATLKRILDAKPRETGGEG